MKSIGIKLIGKKGMMDDFFDFIFTVTVAFFMLWFIFWVLDYNITNSNDASLEVLRDYQRLDSGINNLRVMSYEGYNLESVDINKSVSESKVLGGKIITNCRDYYTKEDCNKDRVLTEKGDEFECKWNDAVKECEFLPKLGTMAVQP